MIKEIKENKDIVAFSLHHNFTNSISRYTSCTALNYAGAKPAFKKDYKTDKENCRAISILPTLSKVYKRLI